MSKSAVVALSLLSIEHDWVPVLDLGGARFYQHSQMPTCYRRVRQREAGGVPETRYACDDVVVSGLGELAQRYVDADNGR